ncbi:TolC family protein [Sphingomonas oligoaromativorans]|uniref:TolC family protein n=1 Tax=Sphingomonas oligoaromativorans TaxID=575322 RepID=UPI0014207AF6|nr:TolC family protein [Sphingomonas oligoaromativorans]NIJ35141.1 cobalt-zinc-cadmium efflux system outer membrane protein [Sphingomonas oligoaromativorans]
MHRVIAAVLVVTACAASAQAQTSTSPVLTLSQAIQLARSAAPTMDAASAGVRAASAARDVAGLRPNPTISTDIENVGGSRAYNLVEAPKQTVSVGVPVELGGKRSARIAVADAQGRRAAIDQAATEADLRLTVTKAYVEAVAADRRLTTARAQATIADDAVRAAHVRVAAGRASPLEEQRADVLRVNADAAVDRATRLAELAHANLLRRIGRSVLGPLDERWFDRIDSYGPTQPLDAGRTLALATARSDEQAAAAQVKLARSQRIPDVTLSAGARRLPINNNVAAVFGISVPLPLFNGGTAAVAQASAEQERASALRRAAELDTDQAVAQAQADVANAVATARAASGPALASAEEAARIARIGYREGKFGQLDLIDAERTLAETRAAAIDALAAFHNAQAELDRLTTTISKD